MINFDFPRLFHRLAGICALLITLISSPLASYACNRNKDCMQPTPYCQLSTHTCQASPNFIQDPLKFSWPYTSSNDATVQPCLDVSALPRNATD